MFVAVELNLKNVAGENMSNSTIELSKNLKKIAKDLDDAIEDAAGERVGFTLIVYTEDRASYVSTINREDSIREMKNLIEFWGKEMPDILAHEIN